VVRYFSFGDRNVTANIRATRRYDRPDLLVVGELRGEEVPSWFEAAGSGIPVLTTAHSVGLADAVKRLGHPDSGFGAESERAGRRSRVGRLREDGQLQRDREGRQRCLRRHGKGIPARATRRGRHLPEDEFVKLLPPELQLALDGREAGKVYARIKERLGA
jgi:hypothetical protein